MTPEQSKVMERVVDKLIDLVEAIEALHASLTPVVPRTVDLIDGGSEP